MNETKNNFWLMADKWHSTYVARDKVGDFSGGILHPRTMANLDSKGLGPKGRIRIGRKVAYDANELCKWLAARAKPLDHE